MTNLNIFDPNYFSNLTKGSVGFDDMFRRLTDFGENLPKIPTYPPYNIKKTGDNTYVIELALAGFGKQDIEVTMEDSTLTITGHIHASTDEDKDNFIFKGIADRAFTRKFTLADTVEVKNADLINGMLKIWLERFIPESKKPKKIEINTSEEKAPSNVSEKVTKKVFLTEKERAVA